MRLMHLVNNPKYKEYLDAKLYIQQSVDTFKKIRKPPQYSLHIIWENTSTIQYG